MEGGLEKSPQLRHPTDSSDAKLVSGLSTLLVATIQEAKDRISQIEYIFCNQLFPNFQSKSKSWQKVYLEAREAADAWKENEKDLLLQIKRLQFEKEQVFEEYQSLKMQKENFTSIENLSPRCVHELQEELKRKTDEVTGTKRPVSYWRDTRSHQSRVGPDLHDDFLDTPLENMRGNFGKVIKEKTNDLPMPVPENMNFDNSDDETQDMNIDSGLQKQQMSPSKAGTSGFKYIEPVRKKSERESLKGIECKQCRKFYDAVLPNEGKNSDGNKQIRCEHHDGVSRHRYRYAPPSTPEGFWNIGFESEM
ncbi:gamma response 1 [Olea europaea subsp. europaea]|uniref:Gamma response 1 n=1 Tax=Olea europaea subsp. europaea TaxID=158383 RepID=A0A8S0P6Y7_OLEEU|nr:gamma response 1 [Olea europaea subsp. europaea]